MFFFTAAHELGDNIKLLHGVSEERSAMKAMLSMAYKSEFADMEKEVMDWLEYTLEIPLNKSQNPLKSQMSDGFLLLQIMSSVFGVSFKEVDAAIYRTDAIKKIQFAKKNKFYPCNTSTSALERSKTKDRIRIYLNACSKIVNMRSTELFLINSFDNWNTSNHKKVIQHFQALIGISTSKFWKRKLKTSRSKRHVSLKKLKNLKWGFDQQGNFLNDEGKIRTDSESSTNSTSDGKKKLKSTSIDENRKSNDQSASIDESDGDGGGGEEEKEEDKSGDGSLKSGESNESSTSTKSSSSNNNLSDEKKMRTDSESSTSSTGDGNKMMNESGGGVDERKSTSIEENSSNKTGGDGEEEKEEDRSKESSTSTRNSNNNNNKATSNDDNRNFAGEDDQKDERIVDGGGNKSSSSQEELDIFGGYEFSSEEKSKKDNNEETTKQVSTKKSASRSENEQPTENKEERSGHSVSSKSGRRSCCGIMCGAK
jgi:hypothetical protein